MMMNGGRSGYLLFERFTGVWSESCHPCSEARAFLPSLLGPFRDVGNVNDVIGE